MSVVPVAPLVVSAVLGSAGSLWLSAQFPAPLKGALHAPSAEKNPYPVASTSASSCSRSGGPGRA